MVSEQTAVITPAVTLVSGSSRLPISCHLPAIWNPLAQLMGTLKVWARLPTLPYAMLWEASVVVDLVNEPERHDPVAAEKLWQWPAAQ